ncbi:MAG: hypothetical protein WCA95_17880 [Opitutaceae bacterium]|jgi:hypothetical protein
MKNSILPIVAFLAALAAAILLPVGAVAAGGAVTLTGLFAVILGDYGRTLEPLAVPAPVVPFSSPASAEEREAA